MADLKLSLRDEKIHIDWMRGKNSAFCILVFCTYKGQHFGWVWWHMSLMLALEQLRLQ